MTHLTIQQLVAQTDGALTGPSLTLVEKHIAECETCWHEMERLAEQDALLASIITVDPGDAFFDDLAASVEAEISGKKKPAPRPAAHPVPAPPPMPVAIQRPERVAAPPAPAIPSPEPQATSPATPNPEPEATNPAPIPVPDFDVPPADAPERLPVESIGAWRPPAPGVPGGMTVEPGGSWTPPAPPAADRGPMTIESVGASSSPTPTPDDPFADLVFSLRSAVAPAPKPAPVPDDPFADLVFSPRSAAAPAPKTAPKPVTATPTPRPVVATPAPRPPAAAPAFPAAPLPRVEPTPTDEPRRQPLAVPILIGVVAFIAGLAVAVVVVIRLAGPGGILSSRIEPGAPATARPVSAPPAPAAPVANIEPAPPAVEPAPSAPVVEPRPESLRVAPPVEQAPAPVVRAAPRPRLHAPPAASSAADNAALDARPTVVIPVRVIRSETMAPVSPPAPAPAPTAPASELGILCGAVRDGEGHPVARAQVMMADVGVVVLTDRAGRFCLTAPVGERTLSVVALGFTASRRLISLNKRTPELNLTLQPAAPFPTAR